MAQNIIFNLGDNKDAAVEIQTIANCKISIKHKIGNRQGPMNIGPPVFKYWIYYYDNNTYNIPIAKYRFGSTVRLGTYKDFHERYHKNLQTFITNLRCGKQAKYYGIGWYPKYSRWTHCCLTLILNDESLDQFINMFTILSKWHEIRYYKETILNPSIINYKMKKINLKLIIKIEIIL